MTRTHDFFKKRVMKWLFPPPVLNYGTYSIVAGLLKFA